MDVTEFRFSKTKVAKAEGRIWVVGVDFRDKPCALSIWREEFDDGRVVFIPIAAVIDELFVLSFCKQFHDVFSFVALAPVRGSAQRTSHTGGVTHENWVETVIYFTCATCDGGTDFLVDARSQWKMSRRGKIPTGIVPFTKEIE